MGKPVESILRNCENLHMMPLAVFEYLNNFGVTLVLLKIEKMVFWELLIKI